MAARTLTVAIALVGFALSGSARAQEAGCADKEALLAFRSALDPKLTALPSWTADSCPCASGAAWQGVSCTATGRVSKLVLQNAQLTGALPSALSTLASLQELDLKYNALTGTIPSFLTKLTKLTHVVLAATKLIGPVPEFFASMTSLERLGLNENQLQGTLPAKYGALSRLTGLWLSENKLQGTLPEAWSSLTNLEYLWLGDSQIVGTVPASWSAMGIKNEFNITRTPTACNTKPAWLTTWLSQPKHWGEADPAAECDITKGASAKSGNNGAVSCKAFCSSTKAGDKAYPGCVAAYDSGASGYINCEDVRGQGTAEVKCYCEGAGTPNAGAAPSPRPSPRPSPKPQGSPPASPIGSNNISFAPPAGAATGDASSSFPVAAIAGIAAGVVVLAVVAVIALYIARSRREGSQDTLSMLHPKFDPTASAMTSTAATGSIAGSAIDTNISDITSVMDGRTATIVVPLEQHHEGIKIVRI